MPLAILFLLSAALGLKFELNGVQSRRTIKLQNRMDFLKEHPIKFCEDYDYLTGKCDECFEGYSLFGSQCLLDEADIGIAPILIFRNPYCEIYNSKDQCLTCYDGYVMKNGECDTDYSLSIPPASYIVAAIDPGEFGLCLTITPEGMCKSCFKGSEMDGGRCTLPDYRQHDCRTQNNCYPIVTACQVYSPEGYCKTCRQGSINMNGQCRLIKRASLCEKYNFKHQCVKCSAYASMTDGKCVYKQPFCNKQERDGSCSECNSRSMLYRGQCHPFTSSLPFFYIDTHCISWETGFCVQCAEGWVLGFSRLCKKLRK